MINENPVVIENACTAHYHRRICWSAIFAGAFVGVGLGFLLHLFSIAIGLSAFSSTPEGASVIAIGGILGLLIGVIASMGAAGYVAGHLGRSHYTHCHGGVVYGFVTWSLALLLCALLAPPVSQYVSMYANSLSKSVVVETTNVNVTNESVASNVESPKIKQTQKIITSPPVSPTDMAWSAWIIFVLFFVGALSSCIGACFGMLCKKDDLHPHTLPK